MRGSSYIILFVGLGEVRVEPVKESYIIYNAIDLYKLNNANLMLHVLQ